MILWLTTIIRYYKQDLIFNKRLNFRGTKFHHVLDDLRNSVGERQPSYSELESKLEVAVSKKPTPMPIKRYFNLRWMCCNSEKCSRKICLDVSSIHEKHQRWKITHQWKVTKFSTKDTSIKQQKYNILETFYTFLKLLIYQSFFFFLIAFFSKGKYFLWVHIIIEKHQPH